MRSLSQSPQGNSVLLTGINYFRSLETMMEAENKENRTLSPLWELQNSFHLKVLQNLY